LPARYWAALMTSVAGLARLRRPAAAAQHRATGSPGRERDLSPDQGERLAAFAAPQGADRPALASPLSGSARPRIIALLLVSCTTALVALVALPPGPAGGAALAVGLLTFLGGRFGWPRWILGLGAAALVTAAGSYTVYGQATQHFLAGAAWAHNFELAGVLAFLGFTALVADGAVDLLRRRQREVPDQGERPADGAPSPADPATEPSS
ncbi:MAG: hypothetical protein ACRDZP_05040, partial [Acidimicrobiales bacterium]